MGGRNFLDPQPSSFSFFVVKSNPPTPKCTNRHRVTSQVSYFSLLKYVLIPTFEENGIFLLGMVFLFSQFSPIETIIFNRNFLYPLEHIDFLTSNIKDILPSISFCKILRV